jgi:hypothetical protein
MAPVVGSLEAGALVDADDPGSIAAGLVAVLGTPEAERLARRARILAAARDTYNWEVQSGHLFGEFERLTQRPW